MRLIVRLARSLPEQTVAAMRGTTAAQRERGHTLLCSKPEGAQKLYTPPELNGLDGIRNQMERVEAGKQA